LEGFYFFKGFDLLLEVGVAIKQKARATKSHKRNDFFEKNKGF